jgi:hypothetical protein
MLLFGTKPIQRELPQERKVCPNCFEVTDHTVIDDDLRFTVYFIPLFSLRRQVIYTCAKCGDSHVMPYAEYEAAHLVSQPTAETKQGSPKSNREKAQTILEGKVVGDQINTSLPWSAWFNFDNILKWLYIAFGIVIVVALILLIALFILLPR